MSKLQKILGTIGLVATLGLAGCKEYVTVCSNLESENGKVVNRQDLELGIFSHPEIVIEGDKQYFTFTDPVLCKYFHIGDSVKVIYRQRYKFAFEDTNNDGRKEFIESRFLDNSIIDVKKR